MSEAPRAATPHVASPYASVVIPAYNEGQVIGRCLAALASEEVGPLEIVVAANGCTDDTVAAARAFPGVTVLDLPTPGKIGALNAADEVASTYPRIYLDADIELGQGALRALIDALSTDQPRCAAPQLAFDLDGCSYPVRAFHEAFLALPAMSQTLVGRGVYGVSRAGRARWGAFPQVQNDDKFVGRLFAPDEHVAVAGLSIVRAPRTLPDLIAVRTRVARGNAQLASAEHGELGVADAGAADFSASTAGTTRALARLAASTPRLWPALAAYTGVTAAARLRARRTASATSTWDRDGSTRATDDPVATAVRTAAPPPDPGRRVAYLNSQYPAVSHTFIEREIAALRDQGWQVHTFSVRPCPPDELRSAAMRAEHERTRVILSDKAAVAAGIARLAGTHPGALARAAAYASRCGYGTLRGKTWQGFYLAEAVLLHGWMAELGLRHLHVHMANVSADVARLVVAIGSAIDGPGSWSWSLTVHGYAEFQWVDQWDVPAKIREARGIAAISDFTRSQLMRLTTTDQWAKIEVVHMSVDPAAYPPPPSPRGHDGPLRLVTVGRLVALKGIPTLIEAVQLLASRGVATHTRVIGDGEDMAALRETVAAEGIEASFELVGAVGQDDLPAYYHWADVYVLPSFMEGLPTVLMEAMATELPAVATNISGVAELVVDGANGLLVRPGRPDQLADALERLAGDPALRARLGAAGRDAVLAEFTPATTGPAIAHFLAQTVPAAVPAAAPATSGTPGTG
ncbi:MAG: glycosyltransferase [Austwickia sp.]|nr:MAG: glycosyltransferase [Austwickia sp.]